MGLKHQEENQTRHFEITAVFLFIYFLKLIVMVNKYNFHRKER